MCVTESLCYTAEIKHSIVYQLYFNKKFLKRSCRHVEFNMAKTELWILLPTTYNCPSISQVNNLGVILCSSLILIPLILSISKFHQLYLQNASWIPPFLIISTANNLEQITIISRLGKYLSTLGPLDFILWQFFSYLSFYWILSIQFICFSFVWDRKSVV